MITIGRRRTTAIGKSVPSSGWLLMVLTPVSVPFEAIIPGPDQNE
jgi:hypothetical protein